MKNTKKTKRFMIVIWNMGPGGIQTKVNDIICRMSKRTYVEILLLVKYATENNRLDNIQKLDDVKISVLTSSKFIANTPIYVLWIMWKYITYQPHRVLTFLDHLSVTMVLIKKMCFWQQSKLILNEDVYSSKFLSINRNFLWGRLVKLCYKHADAVIVPTYACEKDLIHNFDVPKKIITVIPNWTMMSPAPPLKPYWDLLYVGRFENEKNIPGLLSLLNDLYKTHGHIKACLVGSGRLASFLVSFLKKNALTDVIDLPGIDFNIQKYYRRSKVYISTTYNEGMPFSIIESGLYGLPTVVSYYPGVDELIHHGVNGFIGRNAEELKKYSEMLIFNDELRHSMGMKAKKLILQNNYKHNCDRYIYVVAHA